MHFRSDGAALFPGSAGRVPAYDPDMSIEPSAPRPNREAAHCCMSFRELFMRARGRAWTSDEERSFQALDQPTRNALVKQLAAEAGDVATADRRGSDGQLYTAFWVAD